MDNRNTVSCDAKTQRHINLWTKPVLLYSLVVPATQVTSSISSHRWVRVGPTEWLRVLSLPTLVNDISLTRSSSRQSTVRVPVSGTLAWTNYSINRYYINIRGVTQVLKHSSFVCTRKKICRYFTHLRANSDFSIIIRTANEANDLLNTSKQLHNWRTSTDIQCLLDNMLFTCNKQSNIDFRISWNCIIRCLLISLLFNTYYLRWYLFNSGQLLFVLHTYRTLHSYEVQFLYVDSI